MNEVSHGKWYEGIGAAGLTELTALAKDINKTVDQTVKQVARGKIRVGKLLLEARAKFTNDQAFGKWRKEATSVQSKQHAHYLMQVAEQFGNATVLIEGANYSVMQELVLADQSDIDWVEGRIAEGDPPKVQEVRQKVRQTQAERLAPKGTSKKALAVAGLLTKGKIELPNEPANLIVQMELHQRIQEVIKQGIKGIEGDLIILGMDPDPQCPCNPDTLDAIRDYWLESSHGDENHVIRSSYDRVVKEFKGWYTT
ncbi:hypothetical protein LCGC14_0739920 [marine sediment metagenome]|uniref:Uncharacterized protein n=1 Tax=marine sediment metagenome TaxID=412755 RepID=A0A0F9SS00_9ZZZZ